MTSKQAGAESNAQLGEFGTIMEADLASRARWTAFVRQTAETKGMSFAVWSPKSGRPSGRLHRPFA